MNLLSFVNSVKRFAITVVLLVVLAVLTLLSYDLFIQAPINLPVFGNYLVRIILIVGFWLAILVVISARG